MPMSSHVQELRKKHQTLNDQVELASRSPAYDTAVLSQLKKEKLRLKEEIERLSR